MCSVSVLKLHCLLCGQVGWQFEACGIFASKVMGHLGGNISSAEGAKLGHTIGDWFVLANDNDHFIDIESTIVAQRDTMFRSLYRPRLLKIKNLWFETLLGGSGPVAHYYHFGSSHCGLPS
jgi:hypothetical protein